MSGPEKKKRPRRCNQGPKRLANKLKSKTDAAKALELKTAGWHIKDIAVELGRSTGWCSQEINKAIEEIPIENAKAYQSLLVARHEALILAHWSKRARPENAKVIQGSLKHLSDVLGIETARKIEVEMTTNIQGLLDRVQRQCAPDVYEQVLAVLAGDASAAALGASSDGQAEEDDRDAGEPG